MKPLPRQCLFDLAIVATGDADQAINIAINNNISITSELSLDQDIIVEELSNKITQLYNTNSHPATALTEQFQGGINYMGIEIDFIVS